MLVLQRWIAQTKWVAIVLVICWFIVVGIGLTVYLRGHRELLLAAGGTFAAILIGTIAIGYWTGFRDKEVDEDVVMAATRATASEQAAALAAQPAEPEAAAPEPSAPARTEPVEITSGSFSGEDGHAGRGTATVIKQPDGKRVLTFTDFDVDNGVDVDVYLTPGDGTDVSDRIELGDLKGNVGNQQYEIPDDADLGQYSTVVLYCIPFSVRIAIAPLDA